MNLSVGVSMNLKALADLLAANPQAALLFRLPDGTRVPAHFHVTEVGRVRKDFIDCGGTVRSWERCVLQVWVADDREHRVTAGRVATLVGLGRRLLGESDLEVEVEYDVGVITQFPLVAVESSADSIRLRLGGK